MEKIIIDSDEWEDAGQIYTVRQYRRRENSTAVELVLELQGGQIIQRVVPVHSIIWIE